MAGLGVLLYLLYTHIWLIVPLAFVGLPLLGYYGVKLRAKVGEGSVLGCICGDSGDCRSADLACDAYLDLVTQRKPIDSGQ